MIRWKERRTLSLVALIAALGASFAGSVAAIDDGPIDLLFATSYHGDEIIAADGDAYLAVVPDGDGWKLIEKRVRVARVEDAIVDAPGEKTGKEVRVEEVDPLFLVRGGFAPGPVETVDAPAAPLRITSIRARPGERPAVPAHGRLSDGTRAVAGSSRPSGIPGRLGGALSLAAASRHEGTRAG